MQIDWERMGPEQAWATEPQEEPKREQAEEEPQEEPKKRWVPFMMMKRWRDAASGSIFAVL